MFVINRNSSEPVERTTVVNLRKEDYDVYIGRAGRGQDGYFGNPFQVSEGGREACIEKYREYFFDRIANDREFKERVLALRGKTLGCFCKPEACHGDVIADYVNGVGLKCSNCDDQISEPSVRNVRYQLCDGCLNISIIGYDQPRTIGIVGSRRRNSPADKALLKKAFFSIYRPGDTIVSGGCPKGADRFAEEIAAECNIPIRIHSAQWDIYGRSAGFKRNTYIAHDADILIAVVAEDRRGGTEDTIRKFHKPRWVHIYPHDIVYEGFGNLLADLGVEL